MITWLWWFWLDSNYLLTKFLMFWLHCYSLTMVWFGNILISLWQNGRCLITLFLLEIHHDFYKILIYSWQNGWCLLHCLLQRKRHYWKLDTRTITLYHSESTSKYFKVSFMASHWLVWQPFEFNLGKKWNRNFC